MVILILSWCVPQVLWVIFLKSSSSNQPTSSRIFFFFILGQFELQQINKGWWSDSIHGICWTAALGLNAGQAELHHTLSIRSWIIAFLSLPFDHVKVRPKNPISMSLQAYNSPHNRWDLFQLTEIPTLLSYFSSGWLTSLTTNQCSLTVDLSSFKYLHKFSLVARFGKHKWASKPTVQFYL